MDQVHEQQSKYGMIDVGDAAMERLGEQFKNAKTIDALDEWRNAWFEAIWDAHDKKAGK